METKIKIKKGRVPRKLKKQWKKDTYFSIFGWMWIRDYKSNHYYKHILKYWGAIPCISNN